MGYNYDYYSSITLLPMVSLGTIVRLLPCDVEVMGSNLGNNFSTCRGKVAYIYPPRTLPGGSLDTGPPF